MLSRVAENIYWMARFTERAENTARLVNVTAHLLMDLPEKVSMGWGSLNAINGNSAHFTTLYPTDTERNVVRFIVGDLRNPGSILSSLAAARENARTIRDIIPREAWEQVNSLHLSAREKLPQALSQRGRYNYLIGIILGCQQITGILMGSMNRDAGYEFLRLGSNIERADMTTRIIDIRFASLLPPGTGTLAAFEHIKWMSVLKSLSAYQMYRRAMQVRVQRGAVLRFLLQDQQFPRAFRHCLDQMQLCLKHLPRPEPSLAALTKVGGMVERIPVEEMNQTALHTLNDHLQLGLITLHDQLASSYFGAMPVAGGAPPARTAQS